MALIGLDIDRNNPPYTKTDFLFWMPQFTNYLATQDGDARFNKIYEMANKKVFYSIMGTDFEYALSLVIAHYLTLIANQLQAPSGNTLQTIAGGATIKGALTRASVGGFSKDYDTDALIDKSEESRFWNQTSFGVQYMALFKTKAVPSVFVVTSNPIIVPTNTDD